MERKYTLHEEDYLKLWFYFQDKAVSVKGAMFNTITWILGLAAALLGFILTKLADTDSQASPESLNVLAIALSIAGLVICIYAFFSIMESAKHISNNWTFADNCLKEIAGLKEIITIDRGSTSEIKQNRELPTKIWHQLSIVVALFAIAFVAILLWVLLDS